MKQFFHKNFAWLAPVLLVTLVGLDQWTKSLAVINLKGHTPFVIWDGVLEFYYYENTGAAWGMLKEKQIFFYILTVAFFVILQIEVNRLRHNERFLLLNYVFILMMAGAAGNFIDRVVQQYVVDFIYVKLIDFPIFNVADIYITVSVGILLVLMLFYYSDEEFDQIIPYFNSKKKKEQ